MKLSPLLLPACLRPSAALSRSLLLGALLLSAGHYARAASATLAPVYVAYDGQIVTNTVAGQTVWQSVPGYRLIYFNVPASFTVSGSPLYVKASYYDAGDGWIKMEYDGSGNAYTATETHARSSRVKTQTFVTAYHELQHPVLAGHENGADLRLNLQDDDGTVLSVLSGSVVIQDTPFTDPQFQQALTKPWLGAYTGETRTNSDVDASSLTDKVMCGYQGWFGAPNDLQDLGWIHWCRSGRMITNNLNTDQWPDMTLYPSSAWFQAEDVQTRSGKTAYVFSDASPEAVDTQFKWMRQNRIDGVFLQRFLKDSTPPAGQNQEWALANVRQAANLEGRVWCIEYDLSLISDGAAFNAVTNDWIWLVNTFKLLQDKRYGYQNGKPVVAIYGMGDTGNAITVTTANKIINWFKTNAYSGPCYVWGGVPLNWLSQWSQESAVYTNFNAIEAWHSSNYAADIAKCATFGATYWPILWPGFSWSNEQQTQSNNPAWFKDRYAGTRYWTNVFQVMTNSSVANLFVGMFDEYDEGTAIMPMSDDPPYSPVGTWSGTFIDNEGAPSDWWLLLTGEAEADMFGQRTNSVTMPTQTELGNRSNIGPEVDDGLGTNDVASRLYRVAVSYDGNTSPETLAGKQCRFNKTPTSDHYFYFNVDDNYSCSNSAGADITIEVQYYDAGGGVSFQLQYDGLTNAYTAHPKVVTTRGTGRWRTVRFEMVDAYLGNRENGGADFRIFVMNNAKLDLSHVWVRKEEREYSAWQVADVGSVGVPGSGTIDDLTDIYTVNGSGTDIYGTADSFAFVNQAMSGDGQLVARVNSVENTASAAKAGVMIRESLAANSTFAAVVVTPSQGVFYLRRPATGAAVQQTTVSNLSAPYWVKVTRSGNTFSGYRSPDGTTWTLIGSDTISMNTTNALLGLAVTAKNNSTDNTSVFQYVSQTGAPLLWTSLESEDPQPTWNDMVDPNSGLKNVSGYSSGLSPQCSIRVNEQAHTGTTALMYSGTDNSTSTSYCYFEVYQINFPILPTTQLSYWIYPQQANGMYVGIDFHCTDGTYLRNSAAVDQNGYSMHPSAGHGGNLPLNAWSHISCDVGQWLNGKTVDKILVGYDHGPATGQFRGYIDDILITK